MHLIRGLRCSEQFECQRWEISLHKNENWEVQMNFNKNERTKKQSQRSCTTMFFHSRKADNKDLISHSDIISYFMCNILDLALNLLTCNKYP